MLAYLVQTIDSDLSNNNYPKGIVPLLYTNGEQVYLNYAFSFHRFQCVVESAKNTTFIFHAVFRCGRTFRCLDKKSFDKVIRSSLGFLVGMSDFSISGTPYFSEDDHRVTFPVGECVPENVGGR